MLFGRTQEDKIALFFILLAIYVLDLLLMRMNLKDELRFITHKRVFRHKPKRRIPFFRQFFLLNYIDQFKKRWIWHYVVFVLTATFSALSFLLHLFCIFFHGNAVLEQVHYAVFLICCLLSCLQDVYKRQYLHGPSLGRQIRHDPSADFPGHPHIAK